VKLRVDWVFLANFDWEITIFNGKIIIFNGKITILIGK